MKFPRDRPYKVLGDDVNNVLDQECMTVYVPLGPTETSSSDG